MSRGIGTTIRRQGEPEGGPIRHAITGRRRTRTGRTWEALCGAGVYHAARLGLFDPAHPRACPRCSAVFSKEGTP